MGVQDDEEDINQTQQQQQCALCKEALNTSSRQVLCQTCLVAASTDIACDAVDHVSALGVGCHQVSDITHSRKQPPPMQNLTSFIGGDCDPARNTAIWCDNHLGTCPLCEESYPHSQLELHASNCDGKDHVAGAAAQNTLSNGNVV